MYIESIMAAYNANGTKVEKKKKTMEEKMQAAMEAQASVINDIQNMIDLVNQSNQTNEDRALIDSVRQAWGLTDRDNVQIFVVPMGQLSRMPFTNFVTRPTTSRRLQEHELNVSRSRRQIQDLQNGTGEPTLTDEERARRISGLEAEVVTNRRAVSRERARLSRAPRSGVIVVER